MTPERNHTKKADNDNRGRLGQTPYKTKGRQINGVMLPPLCLTNGSPQGWVFKRCISILASCWVKFQEGNTLIMSKMDKGPIPF